METAAWPIVTLSPIVVGCVPVIAWTTVPSWMLVRRPTRIRVDVAADDGAHPDAALLADLDVADDLGAGVDESGGIDAGELSAVGTKHYEIIAGG